MFSIISMMFAGIGIGYFFRGVGMLRKVDKTTSMTVLLLPSITRYSGKDMIPVAIFHGVLMDLSVPFFVSFFCSL